MDPLKIILFAAAFLGLLLLGRLLSRVSEVHAASLPRPSPLSGSAALAPIDSDSDDSEAPAVIGSEIPFPISLPPVQQRPDGTFNRPEILNYYFAKTDLLKGPSNPDSLLDELTIETQDLGNKYNINYVYTVATPSGLRRAMDEKKLASLRLGRNPVIIVPRWDLTLILQTVLDDLMENYGLPQNESLEQSLPADESAGWSPAR